MSSRGKREDQWPKVSKYGVFSGPNTGKYRPEETPYLDSFQEVKLFTLDANHCLR